METFRPPLPPNRVTASRREAGFYAGQAHVSTSFFHQTAKLAPPAAPRERETPSLPIPQPAETNRPDGGKTVGKTGFHDTQFHHRKQDDAALPAQRRGLAELATLLQGFAQRQRRLAIGKRSGIQMVGHPAPAQTNLLYLHLHGSQFTGMG